MNRSSNSRVWKPARTRIAISPSAWPWRCSASISSPTQRASSSASHKARTTTLSPSPAWVHRVLPSRPSIVRDHPAGGAEDARGRTVVFFEPDHRGAGKIRLETQDVADLRAAPAVDRLVVVTDTAQIAPGLGQETQPQILRDVGVLVFVDQQVAEAPVVVGEDFGVAGQQRQIVQQEIAEIDGVDGLEPFLITPVECHRAAVGKTVGIGARKLVGAEAAILPALDDPQQHARRPAPLVDVLGLQDLLQQANLVVGVEDGKARFEPGGLGVAAQDARGDRMKGAEPEAVGGAADHRLEALAHLARRLVGEGDRQQFGRKSAAGGEDMGQPRGQHPGLAGAGAGQHQDRAVDRFDRAQLRVVEAGEIGRGGDGRAGQSGAIGHPAII